MKLYFLILTFLICSFAQSADLNNFCHVYSDLLGRIDQDQYVIRSKRVLEMSDKQIAFANKIATFFSDDELRRLFQYYLPDLAPHLPPSPVSMSDLTKAGILLVEETGQWNKFLLHIASERPSRLKEIAEIATQLSISASKSDVAKLVEMASSNPDKLEDYLKIAKAYNTDDLSPIVAGAIYKISPPEQALAIAKQYEFSDLKSVESYVIQSKLKEFGVIGPRVAVAKEWPGILKYLQFYRMYQSVLENRRLLLVKKIEEKLSQLGVLNESISQELRAGGSSNILAMSLELEKKYEIDLPDEALRSIPGIDQFSTPNIQFTLAAFNQNEFVRTFGDLPIKEGLSFSQFVNDANQVHITYPEMLKVAWDHWEKNPELLEQIKVRMLSERPRREKEIVQLFAN